MKQLTGLDATFLYVETDKQFGHVSGLSILKRPEGDGYAPYDAWKASIAERLHLLEPLRRRLVEVPMGIDHPFWIEDPDFDLDYHVRHTAIPPPGGPEQLSGLVARIIGRPLDRRHPLWETYVIEGLPDGRFAILTKVHHATVDGASGAELLTMMLDDSPEGAVIPPPTEEWRPEAAPSAADVMARAGLSLARKPGRFLLLGARTARELGEATRNPALAMAARQVRASLRGPVGALLNIGREREQGLDKPPAMANLGRAAHAVQRDDHRAPPFAFRSQSLNDVKAVKNAIGATINDVVMAMCAGGLRTYLENHDALPDESLVAMVPVSIRTGMEEEKWTNRVSGLLAALPTDEPDPLERIRIAHESMRGAKELFNAVPAETLTDFTQFSPPAVFAQATRLATRLRLGERLNPAANVTVSNVPGPRNSLYMAGAELLHYYPVSTILDGQGLNITVQSYRDSLDWGLVSCRELVPDLDDLLANICDELAVIAKAANVSLES